MTVCLALCGAGRCLYNIRLSSHLVIQRSTILLLCIFVAILALINIIATILQLTALGTYRLNGIGIQLMLKLRNHLVNVLTASGTGIPHQSVVSTGCMLNIHIAGFRSNMLSRKSFSPYYIAIYFMTIHYHRLGSDPVAVGIIFVLQKFFFAKPFPVTCFCTSRI